MSKLIFNVSLGLWKVKEIFSPPPPRKQTPKLKSWRWAINRHETQIALEQTAKSVQRFRNWVVKNKLWDWDKMGNLGINVVPVVWHSSMATFQEKQIQIFLSGGKHPQFRPPESHMCTKYGPLKHQTYKETNIHKKESSEITNNRSFKDLRSGNIKYLWHFKK